MWNGQFNKEYEEAAEEIIANFQKDVRTNLFLAQMLGEGDGPDTKARRDLFSGPMSRRRFHQGVDEEDSDEGVEEALRVADRKFSEDIAVVVRLMNKYDDDAVISELYWFPGSNPAGGSSFLPPMGRFWQCVCVFRGFSPFLSVVPVLCWLFLCIVLVCCCSVGVAPCWCTGALWALLLCIWAQLSLIQLVLITLLKMFFKVLSGSQANY